MERLTVGILLFEDVEVLDFAGPFEVFSRTRLEPGTDSGRCSLLLARAGLLRNRRATTHWAALDLLGELDSSIDVRRSERFVRDGVISSAGVSAGIDMALAVVEDLHGREVADETARYIEYPRRG